jgi:hypothetical protein
MSRQHLSLLRAFFAANVAALCGARLAAQTVISGTYTGATISGDISIAASTSATFRAAASGAPTTFTGANASFGTNATLYWEQGGTLSGKALTFASGSLLYLSATGSTLTLASDTTATGSIDIYSNGSANSAFTNNGAITHTIGTGNIYAPTFTNNGSITATAATLYLGYPNTYNSTNTSTGTITANGSGTTVYIRGNFANNGTLTAQNSGVLLFDGTNTTGNLGTVVIASGGHARLNGTITNTALSAPTGGTFELYGGTISGGTIAAGALSFTSSGGYLSGATLNDSLNLGASSYVRFTGGASFTGPNLTLGTNANLYWEQVGTLADKALTFASGGLVYITGANNALTLGPNASASGDVNIYSSGSSGTSFTNQGTITYSGNGGSIYAPTFVNSGSISATSGTLYVGYPNTYNSTNAASGTITATGSGTTVYIRGNFSNSGTLTAQNSGVLFFDGTNTSGNLGNVVIATGGHARLNGTITNTALSAPTGGTFELYGGTISGGTIAAGALSFTSSGGYLSGATLNDSLNLGANAYVRFTGGASFTGPNLTLATNANLYWEQVGTLADKVLTFSSGGLVYINGANNALTFGPNASATGDVSIYSSGSSGTSFTNQGIITYSGTNSGSIYAPTFINSGAISATSGTLYLGYPNTYNSTNTSTGTVTANGSGTTVYIRGNFANNGTLTAQNSAVLLFDGANTTGNLGNVVIATGGHARLNGTITNTALSAPTGGTFELYGGTISGGTIAAGALSFTNSGGYLSGATLNDSLNLAASSYVRFTAGASFTGPNLTLGTNAGLYWEQVGTLADKTLTFGSGGYVYITGANNGLTLGPNASASGDVSIYSSGSSGTSFTNQGTITYSGNGGSIYAPTLINSGSISATSGTLYLGYPNTYNATNTSTGTVTATGSGTTVYIRGNFANNGTLTAQNSGVLLFDGTNTTGNLGNVQIATDGHARLNGTLTNTALSAPTGGTFELYGGTISGGTVAAGALTFTSSGGYLDGATLNDNLTLGSSTHVRLTGGAAFTGSTATLGNNAAVYWEQIGSLTAKTLNFGSGAYIYINGTNNTLTLAADTTVTGDVSIFSSGSSGSSFTNLGTINHAGSSGSIYAPTFTNSGTITATSGTMYLGYPNTYSSTNTANGIITASGSGTNVYVRGAFVNNGTIVAQNAGSIIFDGTSTTSNLGNVQVASGGHAYLNGTFANTSATLNAPGGGAFELYGGTITGGTIASGALSFTSSGGNLVGTTVNGGLALPSSTHVYFKSGTTFLGATLSLAGNSGIYWQQVGTLAGKTITFGSGSYLYVTGTNNALTLDAATSGTGDISIYADGSSGTTIRNEAMLLHNTGSGSLYAASFTNAGTITAAAGSLSLGSGATGSTFVNQSGGTINVTGGSVFLQAPTAATISNQGTIAVQSGTLYTGNHLTNAASGTISGAGTINGNVTMAGGTLAPGNSIGTLTLQSGTLSITSATVFAFEISGTSSDQLVFQNPTSVINLGAGLVSLSVNLLGAPTANTTYNLLRISSGGSGITGTFAGLPNSGDLFTASYNGTPYTFSINYSTNVISALVTGVPEPSTYVLLGLGVAALAWSARRRRS